MADTNIQSTQVKVTLPQQLYEHVQRKADQYGLSLSSYMKHLVVNDVDEVKKLEKKLQSMNLPTFQMSEEQERASELALEEHRQGKTTLFAEI